MNTCPKIIGRENEQAELQNVVASVKDGKGGIILISGEAGVGKTLLAEETLAESELSIFTARSTDEAHPAYGAIVTLFRNCFRAKVYETIDLGPLAPCLALLFPELDVPQEPPERDTLIEAIITALVALARKHPLAFLLDDLHWTDNATLEILPSVADRIQNEPLLVVGTYRNDEILNGNRLRWMRNELRRRRRLLEINLEPLNRQETASLISQVVGDTACPTLVQTIYEYTDGLPLFVEELSNILTSKNRLRNGTTGIELIPGAEVPIPQNVRDAVLLRLDSLSDEARTLLEIAATVGVEFDLEILVHLAGTEAGLDELFDRNFVVEIQSGRAAFRHGLTRTAVVTNIPWSKSRVLHRDIATYLASKDVSQAMIAEHWLKANERNKAWDALIQAAEKSCQLYAYWDATKTFQRALEIWPKYEDESQRLQAVELLAYSAQLSGQLAISEQAWSELVNTPSIQEDSQRYADAQRSLATIYSLQGKSRPALKAHETSMKIFQEVGMLVDAAVEAIATVEPLVGALQLSEAEKRVKEAVRLTEQSPRKDLHVRALGLKAFILAMRGEYPKALEIARNGLTIALEHDLTEAASVAYRRMGGVLEYASDFPGAKEAYFTALDHCQRQGGDVLAHDCMGCLAYILFRSGDWARSTTVCQQIMSFSKSPALALVKAHGTLGLIHAFRGEMKQARRLTQQSSDLASRYEISMTRVLIYWGIAVLAEQEEADSQADEYYKQMIELWGETEDCHDAIAPLCSASTFFAINGMEAETSLCAKALSTIASKTGNPEALAGLAYALGETSLLNDNVEEAVHQFSQALKYMEKLSIPLEQARAGYRLGAALASGKERRGEAIRHLNSAYRVARKLGARPLASQISNELAVMGEAAEERRGEESVESIKRGGLSRRQMEILRLVATGLTNKEMAVKLFLSPRTVEMHVAHVLDRLNCRSRSEAVRKAGELGLLD